ncbi:MAG TPA: hypothetical protein VMV09_10725 [Candidatus Saccharimonadales bacterium]|nr:hypothetical protein [Candidatus Saccharimonadales bacterium]
MPAVNELWIKVPSPFWGVETVGFSVRCPSQPESGPLPDIPFFVEGDAGSMASLDGRLRLFPQRERYVDCEGLGEAYGWTDPIKLTDEVIVMAFRDKSLNRGGPDPERALLNRLSNQLVLLAFPFLRDCVRVGGLRLSSPISVKIGSDSVPEIDLSLPLGEIVESNGSRSLMEL